MVNVWKWEKRSLEMYVSAKGVKYTINEYIDKYPDVILNKIKNDGYSGKELDAAYDDGVEIIKEIYEFTGKMLGAGLARAATILSLRHSYFTEVLVMRSIVFLITQKNIWMRTY